jgi:hypothetical protein
MSFCISVEVVQNITKTTTKKKKEETKARKKNMNTAAAQLYKPFAARAHIDLPILAVCQLLPLQSKITQYRL